MYLVDTSVWIDYFRNHSNKAVKLFREILDNKIPFGLTPIVYQEILQGAATKKDWLKLDTYLTSQTLYYPKDLKTYQQAAAIYFNSKRNGITIRSTIDCLIAQIAIENKLVLLHNDKDFSYIQTVSPSLKTALYS